MVGGGVGAWWCAVYCCMYTRVAVNLVPFFRAAAVRIAVALLLLYAGS